VYDKIFLHIPIIKMMVTQSNIMLFASNLGLLLENGVQLSEALSVVAKITPNYYYSQEIVIIRKNMISRGIGLSEAMGMKDSYVMRQRLFPLELLQIISLKSAGAMFSERIRTTVKSLSELLEPILILCVGLLVAVILLSIMLPLFNLGKVIRKQ
jgi:type II secretory pathway component PulF